MPKDWYKPFMISQLLLLQDKTYVAETCLQVVWLQRKLHKSYGDVFSNASSPRGIITYQAMQIIYIFSVLETNSVAAEKHKTFFQIIFQITETSLS